MADDNVTSNNTHDNYVPSMVKKDETSGQAVPLWLITFTDVMALMLTFFVLLYAMAVPEEEKWEGFSVSISSRFSNEQARPYNTGSQDVPSIDKINKVRALDLNYLKAIIANFLKVNNIENVIIFQAGNSLIVSLPSELLFESGSANINVKGKRALFSLGGILSRVKNRIEIVGHTDPRPITGSGNIYKTNWELSLARSSSVAAVFNEVGYDRHISVKGVSSARYDEMPDNVSEEKRYNLSRRVDIVIMNDRGFHTKAYRTE